MTASRHAIAHLQAFWTDWTDYSGCGSTCWAPCCPDPLTLGAATDAGSGVSCSQPQRSMAITSPRCQ